MNLIYGVGINDADYVVQIKETIGYTGGKQICRHIWTCPSYEDWFNMLTRCFNDKLKQKRPTYKDSTCINEWLRLSVFKGWRDTQEDVDGKCLDKDIIVPGNKLYSPDTCAYVNQMTNSFVTAKEASRGDWPVGVCLHKASGKLQALCSNPFTKKQEYLGLFLAPSEAHEAWRERKHELAQLVAETESDPRVVEALKKRYSAGEWYKEVV